MKINKIYNIGRQHRLRKLYPLLSKTMTRKPPTWMSIQILFLNNQDKCQGYTKHKTPCQAKALSNGFCKRHRKQNINPIYLKTIIHKILLRQNLEVGLAKTIFNLTK